MCKQDYYPIVIDETINILERYNLSLYDFESIIVSMVIDEIKRRPLTAKENGKVNINNI